MPRLVTVLALIFALMTAFTCNAVKVSSAQSSATTILGASFGLKEVTVAVQKLYSQGTKNIVASNGNFGDGWPNVQKSMTIVSLSGGKVQTQIVSENGVITLQ